MRTLILTAGCAALLGAGLIGQIDNAQRKDPMDAIARDYVRLVLSLGQHDADYVDAYYGPPEWKKDVESAKPGLDAIAADATSLASRLDAVKTPDSADEMVRLRHEYLKRQLSSLRARVRMLKGERLSFDEESKALYDAVAPTYPESHFQQILDRLDQRFPGTGPLVERYDAFRRAVRHPAQRSSTRSFRLPSRRAASERCNTSRSRRQSVHCRVRHEQALGRLQLVSRELPQRDPGQHRPADLRRPRDRSGLPRGLSWAPRLQRAAREDLVRDRGWVEFSVYPLFSPQSLIAEGTANYGIEVAFPGHERADYERTTLFPAAGLDASKAGEYYEVQALVDQLSYAGNEAARQLL